jgi:hypothetical protein
VPRVFAKEDAADYLNVHLLLALHCVRAALETNLPDTFGPPRRVFVVLYFLFVSVLLGVFAEEDAADHVNVRMFLALHRVRAEVR